MDSEPLSPLVNSVPAIPVENIYYLYCYAWDHFEEAKSIPLGATKSPDLPNLLAKVLLGGTRSLMRRGLDRNYQPFREEIATVRGRIELSQTLALQSRNVRRLVCEFDELGHDLLHNRVLKASLRRLAQAPSLERQLARDLVLTARRMPNVGNISLERSAFARVQLHRNNAYYRLLLKVAELAFECLLPNPRSGKLAFQDVLRDEKKMGRVFEAFVRNFYKKEQSQFSVQPLTIKWDALPLETTGTGQLPSMIVDVFLTGPDRHLIIDTKYYAAALQRRFERESFHSANMYQLFSYLRNAERNDPRLQAAEGMLLYPRVQYTLRERFMIHGHRVTIATIDLAKPWHTISADLLTLLSASNDASDGIPV